jgi:hypothetical protein
MLGVEAGSEIPFDEDRDESVVIGSGLAGSLLLGVETLLPVVSGIDGSLLPVVELLLPVPMLGNGGTSSDFGVETLVVRYTSSDWAAFLLIGGVKEGGGCTRPMPEEESLEVVRIGCVVPRSFKLDGVPEVRDASG